MIKTTSLCSFFVSLYRCCTVGLTKQLTPACLTVLLVFLIGCSSSDAPPQTDAGSAASLPVDTSTDQSVAARLQINKIYKAQTAKQTENTRLAAIAFAPSEQVLSPVRHPQPDTENYADFDENPVVLASKEPTSTFSIDVDTGAYANVRRFIEDGRLPPANAVRIEELINYFNYDYEIPESPVIPFSVTTELAPAPWQAKRHLLHVGLQGYKPAEGSDRVDANLVFLLDVSGSMHAANKLGLVKSSIKMLARQLGSGDSVSIVVYAGATGVVLEPTAGDRYPDIANALDQLQAGGSTNGEAGITLAYQMATKAFKEGGTNRVILATDGDFNVGVANIETLKDMIARERESGIALTTLGFGQGNYNDHLMESLADIGNGNYAYIDSIQEARKVLVEEMDSTLLTIARDVKIQIEFNPAVVAEYRLVGYVNRRLANEDFNNDKVDAGEIGAGHTVTALYEIALHGRGTEFNTPLRYAAGTGISSESGSKEQDELLQLRLRYKPVLDDKGNFLAESETQNSKLITRIVQQSDILENIDDASESFRFSSAVAAFGQQLRHGKYTGEFSLSDTIALAESSRGSDRLGYRAAFLQLARLASSLMPIPASSSLNENVEPERDSG